MSNSFVFEKRGCACGRDHLCPIEEVIIKRGAASELGRICERARTVLLVADENTLAAAGDGVLAALSGKRVTKVVFSGKKILVPDEAAVARAKESFSGDDVIVGVGSGVIQDLCKYLSHDLGVPYVIVATAPSMDGYASNGAAMILTGMKITVPAGLPKAIIADPAVLAAAPRDMIRAGFGDIVGKYSALSDWELSRVVNGEYFCEEIYSSTLAQTERVTKLSDGVNARDEDAVAALMEALVTVGVNMSFAGSSRPASGSEHHLSHFFEITGILEEKPYLAHGIDVAFSTAVTAKLRESILALPRFVTVKHDREKESRELSRVYGRIAPSCAALQKKAGFYDADRSAVYADKESEIRAVLAKAPSAETVRALNRSVGLDEKDFYSFYGESKIKDAVLYAKDLKDRFTVLWTAYDLGVAL